jgi:diaminohydroxyphosphoribosylaminopyrimidine deaminase/5-amino-6-(5-phosphoribosylamino)uracil reductase
MTPSRAETLAGDERWMDRCLELALRAEGRTNPNPLVGCVIVSPRGEVVAEGYHRKLGAPHAEAEALAQVGGRAPGCTLYVNLEPCIHTKARRTEPCAPKVAAAGLARVVVGMLDPIRAHGGGARWLAAQGVEVTRGVARVACLEANRAFTTWANKGRPYTVLKAGASLDGKIATRTGESKWITGDAARRDAHRLRDRLQAILVGVETVLADDPSLTTRGQRGGRDPIRVVLDSRLRTPLTARVVTGARTRIRGRCIIATTPGAPAARERRLVAAGAEVWRIPGPGGQVDLDRLVARLARTEISSLLVEGGATVHGAFLEHGLADELVLYLAPMVLGAGAAAWADGTAVARLADAYRLRFTGAPRRLGEDLVLTARMG